MCAPSYSYRAGRLLIEAKEEIKKRLGESPDRADCYVMGLAGLEFLRRTRYFGTDSVKFRPGKAAAKPSSEPAMWSSDWYDQQELLAELDKGKSWDRYR